MNDFLSDTLLKTKKHPDSPYVFCNKDGKPYGSIKTAFWHALKRAKIRNFRFHDFKAYICLPLSDGRGRS